MNLKQKVASVLLIVAGLVTLHQFVFWHVVFELKDIHHETFITALVFSAIIVMIFGKKR